MKKFLNLLVVFLSFIMLFGCDGGISTPDTPDNPKGDDDQIIETHDGKVEIFAINDTHGAIKTDGKTPGMEKVQSVIKSIEKSSSLIKVANGDIFQGGYVSNETHGRVFIDVLNAMKFDCFVIGNHEFDWGFEEISKYKDGNLENGEADFPFLGANIVDKRTNEKPEWLDDYVVVENNGFKVGIIGVIGEHLTSSIAADKVANYTFMDPVPIVENLAEELRVEKKCDVVVVSTHEYESSTNERYARLENNSRIDGIICAHTHQYVEDTLTRTDGVNISAIQSNTKNLTVGLLTINLKDSKVTSSNAKHYKPINYENDEGILKILDNYSTYFDLSNKKIGHTNSALSRDALGAIAIEAMTNIHKTDFAIMNTGGVRTTIPAGDIYAKNIYECFPFDNEIYVITLKGYKLKELISRSGDYLYYNCSYYELEENKEYKIAVIDYVFTGTYYTYCFEGIVPEKTGAYIKDAVVEYFRNK